MTRLAAAMQVALIFVFVFDCLQVSLACDGQGEECPQSLSFLQVALESREAVNGFHQSIAKDSKREDCPTPEMASAIFRDMLQKGLTLKDTVETCAGLGVCVDSTQIAVQEAWAQAGAIDFVAAALHQFADNETAIVTCTMAMSPLILFNRPNGLHAGKLGGLNATLNYYGAHLDRPLVMDLGGAIGAYFDFVNENRAIARELGGVQMFIQNIRNNFHGQFNDWANEPVKQSLYAMSSGTWTNADIAMNEGFVALGIQLMKEHGNETKIAEETLQAVKAMAFASDSYRSSWSDQGIFEALPGVLYDNQNDRGAISLVCEGVIFIVGPDAPLGDPVQSFRHVPHNATIQKKATDGGMLEALLYTAMSETEMEHFDHGSFNFNLDLAYPAKANCFLALQLLGKDNPENSRAMREAGIGQYIRKDWDKLDLMARSAGCALVHSLGVEVSPLCPFAPLPFDS